jgi:hypothetical protein
MTTLKYDPPTLSRTRLPHVFTTPHRTFVLRYFKSPTLIPYVRREDGGSTHHLCSHTV